ncbi:Trihelix transcription factor GT-3b [Rhynchospora pubera]|uniref:Trihelix transcription factor GT-3b n=1 Tax=Rhynchospora pubera TaxID=906938 RepID=A0AAV8GPX9_9POAL|nr:Trihelix transcription factor GT-3b [Rhynchospora pubera]
MEEHFQHFHFTNPYLNIPPPIPPIPPIPTPPQLPPILPPQPVQSEPIDRERLPQWTHTETAEFLSIRADLDVSFMSTKRNKPLWEAISARLQQKGFSRTPDQCKSKWKNLVTRFKGSEAMEDAGKQFPFYEEMRAIFSRRMDRSIAMDKKKGKGVQAEGKEWNEEDEERDDDDEEEEVEDDDELNTLDERSKKKRKMADKKRGGIEWEVQLALHAIIKQQMEMQTRWVEESEAREAQRREKEEKWRRTMIDLCEERLALTRRWREREDERNARAEARAERQHSLVTSILAKLAEDER